MNYNQSLNLQALPGSLVIKAVIDGKEQTFVAIPTNAPYVFVGNSGIYASLTIIENREQKFGHTHCCRPSFRKEEYEKLTEDQKKQIPICGDLTPIVYEAKNEAVSNAQTIQVQAVKIQQEQKPVDPGMKQAREQNDPNLPF